MQKGARKSNKRKEMWFLVGAAFLTLTIIAYLFWLVHLLSDKADQAFGALPTTPGNELQFNFEKYQELLKRVNP